MANDEVVQTADEIDPAVLQMGAPQRLSDTELRGIESFDDAVRAAAAIHGEVENYAEKYGTGFQPIDKTLLVNKTIVLVEWHFNSGDWGSFVSAVAVANDGTKGIINDGSTGLHHQLRDISKEQGKFGGLMVSHGLSVSSYPVCAGKGCGLPRPKSVDVCEHCGDKSEARAEGETYYLSMAE